MIDWRSVSVGCEADDNSTDESSNEEEERDGETRSQLLKSNWKTDENNQMKDEYI